MKWTITGPYIYDIYRADCGPSVYFDTDLNRLKSAVMSDDPEFELELYTS